MSFTIKEDKLLFEGKEIDHISIYKCSYYNHYVISCFYKANFIGSEVYLDKNKAYTKYQEYLKAF